MGQCFPSKIITNMLPRWGRDFHFKIATDMLPRWGNTFRSIKKAVTCGNNMLQLWKGWFQVAVSTIKNI
jgi:hypothetical protein